MKKFKKLSIKGGASNLSQWSIELLPSMACVEVRDVFLKTPRYTQRGSISDSLNNPVLFGQPGAELFPPLVSYSGV